MQNDCLTVSVRVNRALREYLVCANGGSDILHLDWKSPLWIAVKSRLRTSPRDYKPVAASGSPDIVRIELPTTSGGKKLYNDDRNTEIHNNFLFRNWLDEQGQRVVEELLAKRFKKTFRDFLTGAFAVSPDTPIKDAIYTFCECYHITMEHVTFEMLRKDWYRYKHRSARGEPDAVVKCEIS